MSTRIPFRTLFSEAAYCVGAALFIAFGALVLFGLSTLFAAEAFRVVCFDRGAVQLLAIPFGLVALFVAAALVLALRREVPLQWGKVTRLVRHIVRTAGTLPVLGVDRSQPAAGLVAVK